MAFGVKSRGRKIPEIIHEEEVIKIVKAAQQRNHKLAILLGFYQAMRVSEVVKLTKENIDYKGNIIKIKSGKGDKDRNIPISPKIKRYLKHLPIGTEVRAIQRAIKRYALKALKKDLHFHTLRHSGATHYLNKKIMNLRQLQVFLGHADISATQIYTHVSNTDLQEAMLGKL